MQKWTVYDFEDGSTEWVKGGYTSAELFEETQKHGKVVCKLSYLW